MSGAVAILAGACAVPDISEKATASSNSPVSEKANWCTYARKWVGIKYYWNLSVTRAEKDALKQMLATCPSR